jgi:hypothetical protein
MVCHGIGHLLAMLTTEPVMIVKAFPFTRPLMNGALGFPKICWTPTRDLDWLGPVVILHRDHEYCLDTCGTGAEGAQCAYKRKRTQGAAMYGF